MHKDKRDFMLSDKLQIISAMLVELVKYTDYDFSCTELVF